MLCKRDSELHPINLQHTNHPIRPQGSIHLAKTTNNMNPSSPPRSEDDSARARKRTSKACDSCYKRKVLHTYYLPNLSLWLNEDRLNVTLLSRSVTGVVTIIRRVHLRGVISVDEGRGMILGMKYSSSSRA